MGCTGRLSLILTMLFCAGIVGFVLYDFFIVPGVPMTDYNSENMRRLVLAAIELFAAGVATLMGLAAMLIYIVAHEATSSNTTFEYLFADSRAEQEK